MEITGKKWRRMAAGAAGNSLVSSPVRKCPDYLYDYIPPITRRVSSLDPLIVYGFRGGKKFFRLSRPSRVTDSVVRTPRGGGSGFNGGFLLKILPNGTYSVVGVARTAAASSKRSIDFMRF